MQIGAMNNPNNDLLEEIKFIGKNKFDFIDLTIEPEGAYKFDLKKVKKLLKKYKLAVIGHTNPFLPVSCPIKSVTAVTLKEFRKYLAIFSELDSKLMNYHPGYYKGIKDDKRLIELNIQFLKKVIKEAREYQIDVMVENFIDPFNNVKTFTYMFKKLPQLKLHLDIGHVNLGYGSVEHYFKKLGKKIVHLHVSDNFGEDDLHLPIGAGNIDWQKTIKVLKKYRYNKTITLEIFSPDKEYILISKQKFERLWRGRWRLNSTTH